MKYVFGAGALVASLLAAPLAAQDQDTAGGKFVAGAIVGIDSVNIEVEDVISDAEEDVVLGATIGYDYETQSGIVIGIEGEYTDSGVGASGTDLFAPGDRLTINAGRDFYVGGRLGFRPGRNGLLYVKAGYTNASIEGEYDDGIVAGSDEQSFDGIRVGVGGEIDLSSNYAMRVEYRYSDYGSIEALGVDTGLEVSRNQGVITLLGKF